MQFKITVELPEELSTLIQHAFSRVIGENTTKCDTLVATRPAVPATSAVGATKPAAKGKPGRPKKPVEEPVEDTVEDLDEPTAAEEPTEEVEESFDDDGAEEAVEDDADRVVNADEQKKLKGALRTFSDKNGRDAAAKILMKFGKVTADVKSKDLPKLLKALKVA